MLKRRSYRFADDLKEFFEGSFGPVEDAIVIGSQTSTGMHSRGFGFVAFKSEKIAQKACKQHYVVIFGKKVGEVERLLDF
jgi:RNA recognition motif-containing protein